MIKKSVFCLSLLIIVSFTSPGYILSYDDKKTHPTLASFAAENSVLSSTNGDYLINIGFQNGLSEKLEWNKKQEIIQWLSEGGELEDAGNIWEIVTGRGRFSNHFHNPLKSRNDSDPEKTWDNAGLDDWIFLINYKGQSSLLWAQAGTNQQTFPEGDWSWNTIRNFYFLALTGDTQVAREENFAKTFRGLGHQMHLIQDAAVPAHVRNDAHPLKSNQFGITFENWVRKNEPEIIPFASTPIFPEVSLDLEISYKGNNLVPITQLMDTDNYTGTNPSTSLSNGLAEYTNANFFSDDTIFAAEKYQNDPDHRHNFPYPNKSSTNLQQYIAQIPLPETRTASDGVQDLVLPPISKVTHGEYISWFLRPTYFTNEPEHGEGDATYYQTFFRDEDCHLDYASVLIPRAVGYSARLLDYFFRGTIEITSPVIGIKNPPDGSAFTDVGINHVSVLAKNTSSTEEEMQEGFLSLVVKYKIDPADAFENPPPDLSNPFQYVVADLPGTHSISRTTPEKFEFDLSANPIPVNAKQVYLYVVYRGQLGNESDAVAVGYKELEIRTLEITRPDDGVYSFTDLDTSPMSDGFGNIKFLAKNTSPDGEDMIGGTVQLVVKYMVAQANQFQNNPPDPIFEFQHIVKEIQGVSLPWNTPVPLEFDISDKQIPLWATDVTIYLIYKGSIGQENDAAAVGFKDISAPTPVDISNFLDKLCIDGTLYDAGGPEAIAQVDDDGNGIADTDERDVYPHELEDIYIRFSPVDNPLFASPNPGEYHHYIPNIALGDRFRLFVLSDSTFTLGLSTKLKPTHPDDEFIHVFRTESLYTAKGIKNQIYLLDDPVSVPGPGGTTIDIYFNRQVSTYYKYRGLDSFTGVYYYDAIPDDAVCNYRD